MPEVPDPAVFARGELVATDGRLVGREAQLWLVRSRDELAVLRRLDPAVMAPTDELVRDRQWLHDFLTQLASTDFPAPRPLSVFEGSSMCVQSGAIWELVTFIDGDAVGWRSEPNMEAIGQLLARYHDAAAAIVVGRQRPTAVPPAEIHTVLGADAGAAGIDTEVLARFRRHAMAFEELGDQLGHRDSLVIHGDFTNHNVIAAGTPPEPVGVIDFGLAHLEVPLADIGLGLWRSGRPRQDVPSIDTARAVALLRGYQSIRPISPRTYTTSSCTSTGAGCRWQPNESVAEPTRPCCYPSSTGCNPIERDSSNASPRSCDRAGPQAGVSGYSEIVVTRASLVPPRRLV